MPRFVPAALAGALVILAPGLALAADADQRPAFGAIISHTPAWVWGVLALVIFLGLRRTMDRDVSVAKLLIFPLVVIVLDLSSLAATGLSPVHLSGFAIGVMAGLAAGLELERRNTSERLGPGLLRVKGDWSSLVVVLAIFLTRYVTTVLETTDPGVASSGPFHFATGVLTGLFGALTVARAAARLRIAYA